MFRRPSVCVSLAAVICATGPLSTVAADAPTAAQEAFADTVQPLLKNYCFDCHAGEEPDGTVRLDGLGSVRSVEQNRAAWEGVLKMLRGREMPPEDADRPSDADLESVTEWIDTTLRDIECRGTPSPGRVTIRRLNRVEYENTIRDLLGVEFKATEVFPADDVGYGFDNIGDVLSLPPMLMEKYFAAAEQIAGRAIITDPLQATAQAEYDGGQLGDGKLLTFRREGPATLASQGTLSVDHAFPRDGEYLIRTRACGDQAGGEPVRMRLSVDGDTVKEFDVAGQREQPADYDQQFKLTAGKHRVAVAFMNDYYNPEASDPGERDRNLHVVQLKIIGPLGLGPDGYPESHRRIFFVRPGDDLTPDDAARRIVQRLASRAYRRPVRDDELGRLLRLVALVRQQGEGFEQSLQYALTAMLVSPNFLFRIEQDPEPNTPENVRQLNEHELATRLSYFLWSSMPDEQLFDLAGRNELRNGLDSQVERMLDDPKSSALVENFALQWLELRNLADFAPDRQLFPTFNEQLRDAMLEETRLFCEYILRDDRSVLELVDSDYTFVNEPLARHYGINGVSGDDFRRVSLAGTSRGGVITQASVLAVTSNPTRTSPVKRGKWILENILGEPPPDPPANVPQLSEDRRAALSASLRERMEEHRRNPNCAVCHRKMDAMGFAMENFNPVGAWRTKDGNFEIDPSGELPDGRSFGGAVELKKILVTTARDDFAKCLTEKMLTFALGRGLERYDQCAVDKITKSLAENDFRFSALVRGVVQSDPFQKRCGKGQ